MEQHREKEIIATTMSNMSAIYRDIGIILEFVEKSMRGWGFKPQGDSGAVWEVSSSFENTDGWLYRWFARAYTKADPSLVVGLVIHLGGYKPEWIRKMLYFSVELPCVQVSLIQFESVPNSINRTSLYNDLWGLSWNEPYVSEKAGNLIIAPSVKSQTGPTSKVTSYFVDLIHIRTKDQIQKLLAEPMFRMFEGELGWVNDMKLPVMNLEIQT